MKGTLVDAIDIIKEIVMQSANEEIKIDISIEKMHEDRVLIQIKDDKNYALLSYGKEPTKLFIDGDMVQSNIKPIRKRIIFDIENFVRWNSDKFEMALHGKDIITGRTMFLLRKKTISK